MIDTGHSLAKLQGAEAAVNEIRDALAGADDVHRPGLRVALNVADELRVSLSDYHVRMCQAAEAQRAAAPAGIAPSPQSSRWRAEEVVLGAFLAGAADVARPVVEVFTWAVVAERAGVPAADLEGLIAGWIDGPGYLHGGLPTQKTLDRLTELVAAR